MGKALKSFARWRLEENMREYNFYFKKFQRLLMSMFEWNNLPDNISSRFIENKLFYNGLVIFYKSKKLGFYVIAQATPLGLNDYEEPTAYRAYGVNKINEYVKASECVPIWNDMFIEGCVPDVNFFAKSLSNIKKTFDINLEQLKNPYIISCPEGQRETVKQVMQQKTDGVPYIFTADDFNDLVKVNVFNLQIQNHTKELQDVKNSTENEGLTFFGVDNVNIFKRERLTQGESEQNDEQIILNKNSRFKARKKAEEMINSKFGLNVSVELSKDFESELNNFEGDNNVNE
jgi:hypothetical protein